MVLALGFWHRKPRANFHFRLAMFAKTSKILCAVHRTDDGQGLVEYALILAVIALGAAAGMNSVAIVVNSGFATLAGVFGQYVS